MEELAHLPNAVRSEIIQIRTTVIARGVINKTGDLSTKPALFHAKPVRFVF